MAEPAGGDDGMLEGHFGKHLVFNLEEGIGSQSIDETLERFVAGLLNEQVGVDEIHAENLRQHDAQGRLARHRACR